MSEQINITDSRIEVIDDDISAHIEFFAPIDEAKVEVYIAELRHDVELKKAQRAYILANPLPPITDYRVLRAAEYPPITDYIDGVVKGDQVQVQAYIDACLAVKAKYPKPE